MTRDRLIEELIDGTWDTLYMVGLSSAIALLLGIPLGVLLVATAPGGLFPHRALNSVVGAVVNAGRSIPFIILLVLIAPLTKSLAGTTIGPTAAAVPLTLGAIPFLARLVETSLREVDPGKVEAATAMGATRGQVIRSVLLPEALPGLIAGLTVTVVALIGYSAMAGAVGGGGLGDLAIRYGYQRFDMTVTLACVAVLMALVVLVQFLGDTAARITRH
ncbi:MULTISPECIES: methionine ABC transporter permease [Kytococcus]|uniref:ABC transporter permease n=1 Tax=Kytococcus schroeteri TaxID=138300 RepID=A0A2I1PA82_9MICO|nr:MULTISPECIES: methionine ABC transporter permease [Kytococcus]OFS12641.1 metal ABC transporter permease [Kytococcus sp. HMSC28H12]PKZ41517.1 ABC transporter permease [Kytococcus schroeteri]